jgi:predicted nucleotidyltransferase/DNA-binding transcriptional ArsR family regulator
MIFQVSTAKKQVLKKLAEQPWTPTDLAKALDKSRNTVYNHLEALHRQGILTKQKVEAKTRPQTEYSIGNGFIRYIAVLPGEYTEKTLKLTPEKQATLRIWNLPQEDLQPYIEKYWWTIKNSADLDHREDIKAVAVYGSVARGQADKDSDIDFLMITKDKRTRESAAEHLGSLRIETPQGSKIGMTEVYSFGEYRNSLAHQSDFLRNIQDELHVIYDPDRILQTPEKVLENEY